jgi:hypothetical protein
MSRNQHVKIHVPILRDLRVRVGDGLYRLTLGFVREYQLRLKLAYRLLLLINPNSIPSETGPPDQYTFTWPSWAVRPLDRLTALILPNAPSHSLSV